MPTVRIVKDVVQRIMERTKVPNTYQISEVCQILVKDNPELRGKGGCWGIVSQANEFRERCDFVRSHFNSQLQSYILNKNSYLAAIAPLNR
ncbi:hypothetical protein [Nostoc sp. FACHB-133]|uniref:hypothetical protein n=1 Tax=Nostoc sp. FACHB-133 TaxID=2692835 RepID=UPI001F54BB02|nr:hypothetical protein [Nostoc sp. FACHB-133]